jgi:transcriptional regulator with XRE-family HTH domain
MVIKPNTKLKMLLFKEGITQRKLAFAIGIDEAQISKAIRYGQSTEEMREAISRFLGIGKKELFPWDD